MHTLRSRILHVGVIGPAQRVFPELEVNKTSDFSYQRCSELSRAQRGALVNNGPRDCLDMLLVPNLGAERRRRRLPRQVNQCTVHLAALCRAKMKLIKPRADFSMVCTIGPFVHACPSASGNNGKSQSGDPPARRPGNNRRRIKT